MFFKVKLRSFENYAATVLQYRNIVFSPLRLELIWMAKRSVSGIASRDELDIW